MTPLEMLRAALDQGATLEIDVYKGSYRVEIESDHWRAYGQGDDLETAITQAWEDFQQ